MTQPLTAALIVAAGTGTRAGGPIPKQWQPLAGRRLADRTLEAFRSHPGIDRIMLVLHPDDMGRAAEYEACPKTRVTTGAATRDASVRAGLEALSPEAITTVLIHDVARPLISADVIDRVLEALKAGPAAAPALPVTDALWVSDGASVQDTRSRDGLFRAQTPQGFHFDAILSAHRAFEGTAADDVEVARAAGIDVTLVAGDEDNLKITHAPDFARAARILEGRMDIRTGNGFDVHAFGPGDHVTLCGVQIPHTHGLVGHSDADVGMHTITDAIYGALAEGDIGRHFPPSDPQWKGAASEIFLRHAVELALSKGFRITHMDLTLICEHPKIGPHSDVMRAEMARIMGLRPDQVSVKATTSEKLGFTGRGEGIAALGTVTLVTA